MDRIVIIKLILFGLGIILVFGSLLYWSFNRAIKESNKQDSILRELTLKADELNDKSSKEELCDFDNLLKEKSKELRGNPRIQNKLWQMDGYLKGLYKKYKDE